MINWSTVIHNLSDGVDILPDPKYWNLETKGYQEILSSWIDAGYNFDAIKWTNYYPGKHFSQDIETELAQELNVKPLRSWISRIDPGYTAPWHWDVDDDEEKYLAQGSIVRYSIFIQDGKPGQVFMLENESYYNQTKGTVVKWDNYKAWHAGANAGLSPKYMYHLLGIVNA
jgi:hypothetical protein